MQKVLLTTELFNTVGIAHFCNLPYQYADLKYIECTFSTFHKKNFVPLSNNAEYENNRFFLLSISNYFMEKTFLFNHQRILKRPLGLREPTENFND